MSEGRRGLYCVDCGTFDLQTGGDYCPSCGSDETIERRGLICPSCGEPTPSDDPNWHRCIECEQPLPQGA